MSPQRFFSLDRYNQVARLLIAVLLSVAVHLMLVVGIRGTQFSTFPKTAIKTIEARLVGKAEPPSTNILPGNKPNSPPSSELTKGVDAPRAIPVVSAPLTTLADPPPTTSLPLPFDPTFYTWREVDVTAKLKGDSIPPYPKAAAEAGIRGRVVVEVWVDENGKVDDVKVIDASPPGYFEEATLAHYRSLSFVPAMKEGMAKRFRASFLVEFSELPNVAEAGKNL